MALWFPMHKIIPYYPVPGNLIPAFSLAVQPGRRKEMLPTDSLLHIGVTPLNPYFTRDTAICYHVTLFRKTFFLYIDNTIDIISYNISYNNCNIVTLSFEASKYKDFPCYTSL